MVFGGQPLLTASHSISSLAPEPHIQIILHDVAQEAGSWQGPVRTGAGSERVNL